MNSNKERVYEFWNDAACGENLLLCDTSREGYEKQAKARYGLEPYILPFADFASTKQLRVLEIGVGLGADHQRFAEAGANLSGIDLTERAIVHTKKRLHAWGLSSDLKVGDAEHLDFAANTFDLVYSWGVLHHSPDTFRAVQEVWRVLKPGGHAKIMIYNKYSIVGLMLWVRYALFRLKPWTSLVEIYANYLESPGTKAYSAPEAEFLFQAFDNVKIRNVLTHGDLLESGAGQRHQGPLLSFARKVWPRSIIRRYFQSAGLFMLIDATKPSCAE